MIRHALRIFNDGAIVFPVYGSIASDPPPGSMARRYHSRFQIRADGVFVFPAYDTVGGAAPPPAAGTLARRFHDRLRIYNSPFDNVIVFDAYGVQDTPTPTPTPTGQVGTPSGGYFGPVGRRRTPEQLRRDRERFGVIEAAAEIVNDVAIRQVEQPGLDATQQLAELQGELGARGIPVSSEYISLLERLRARYEADALEERDIVFVMSAIAELDDE